MKLRTKLLFAVLVILLLTVTAAPAVKAWDYGPGSGCGWASCGYHHDWSGCGWNGCDGGIGIGNLIGQWTGIGIGWGGGYYAGQQDAIYDHNNNLQYQPYGSCLPCHSQGYWDNFRQGYDQQWNSYQSQESTQGTSITINGNNNYVNTAQYSSQQQNPLQQLAHTVCGFINCGQNQPITFHEGDGGP